MTIKKYGPNATFKSTEVANPTPSNGQVFIKIAASSINTVNTMIRAMGTDLPFSPATPAILGMALAETIEKVAVDVTDFSEGNKMYGCIGDLGDLQGALVDYVAAASKLIALKPKKKLSMKEAASLPLVGITAYQGLKRAQIQSGQKVLV